MSCLCILIGLRDDMVLNIIHKVNCLHDMIELLDGGAQCDVAPLPLAHFPFVRVLSWSHLQDQSAAHFSSRSGLIAANAF